MGYVTHKYKRLIVVAAPSCCGKTTFINALKRGGLGEIEDILGIKDATEWIYRDVFLDEKELLEQVHAERLKMIVHYTLPYRPLTSLLRRGYDKKSRLKIIKSSDNVTLLTLYASTQNLVYRTHLRRKRIYERRREGKARYLRSARVLRKLKRLEQIYARPDLLSSMYGNWFDYCEDLRHHRHYLVNVDSEPRILPLEHWKRIVND